MVSDERSEAGCMLFGFAIGLVSGAALALLYAPTTGRQTREYLGRVADEARNQAVDAATKARDFMDEGRRAAASAFDQWRHTATETIDQGRQILERSRAVVTQAMEEGRQAYQQAKTREINYSE